MNVMNGMPAPPALWQEARNSDGRVYYYNVQTKATQWTKPLELMTPAERALANQPWKEYTAEGGRKYWYNTETKQSSWEMPEVYKTALAQQPPQRPIPAAPTFVAGGTAAFPTYPQQRERDDHDRGVSDRRGDYGPPDTNGMVAKSTVGAQQTEPEYPSFEEAEAAFMKLLRRSNVQPEWTWEQTMRLIIKDPQYRSLRDPRERKAAFEKYALEVRMQEKDRAKERLAKLRADFGTMLRSHPEIKHFSRWKTIRPIIEGETIFRSTSDENERRQLFEEYVIELKKENSEREAAARKAAKEDLADILNALELEPYTRWAEAQGIIQSNERVKNDDKFKALTKSDILTAFENHIKSLERTFNDTRQQQKANKARRERKNREQFIELLEELRKDGKIKAGSKWMNILPVIEGDPRYVAMLGQSGSTPLDLFWDIVEEEERALRGPRNDVLDVLDDTRYEVTPKTTFEEFSEVMATDRRTARIDRDTLHLIFDRVREKVLRRSEDEKHAADRHQRRAIDALRSRIKHLEPPVRASDTWDQVKPRIEKLDEYRTLETDDLRRIAFDKVIRRLKDKEEDAERERDRASSRREHYDRSDRPDRDRGRDRDARNDSHGYRSERRRGASASRLSHTPEPDAYEADRRKAQADRERSYRKASGLSPPPGRERDRERDRDRDRDGARDRDRDRDRDRERDRPSSRPLLSHYDRDRRGREDERERLYRSRADPRSSRDELDYGGGNSGATGDSATRSTTGTVTSERRRRRDSETDSIGSRSAKRYRRDGAVEGGGRGSRRDRDRDRERKERERERERTAEEVKEERAVHSGSEEGEIEEE
ncbi:pre-mRNA-processing protein prp40 [Histoplasma capsulatum var. duboisii H88]|uniref:Pre-mRNA-processing protein prp40 n=1 Tax=Ajellomyces capsulatus (strain H88) TaxID=544711 RepID=F0UB30_AJEC8|nr:pre-mRNA-processing protein prp40 [Histoplasma capsulatum var. duboisii H88]